ncbi:MAG TPA: amidohydrolase family protein [Kofleriaceae bacterium]|nr:amidohydrolase family protein [Kofleriaceae bacterium]
MRRLVAAAALLVSLGCDRGEPSGRHAAPAPRRAIDVHTHFGPAAAARTVALMDAHDVATVVNLSGGTPGRGLEEQLAAAAEHPARIVVFAGARWLEVRAGPGYGERMARDLERAHRLGARGLKIPKGLGLGVVDATGALVAVDAPELDPLFVAAGELGMPVAIHTGDPIAFWQAPDARNERLAELTAHPEWSLYGRAVPSWEELHAALERRIARHPRTTFIAVHFGNAPERPARVSELLDRYPNLYIDTAARVPEIGRFDARTMRAFFVAYQDRILFGTDLGVGRAPGDLMLGSTGTVPPTERDVEHFYAATWRYFETADRAFAHPTPIQGDWTIDGVDLPQGVRDKIYRTNAERLLGL